LRGDDASVASAAVSADAASRRRVMALSISFDATDATPGRLDDAGRMPVEAEVVVVAAAAEEAAAAEVAAALHLGQASWSAPLTSSASAPAGRRKGLRRWLGRRRRRQRQRSRRRR